MTDRDQAWARRIQEFFDATPEPEGDIVDILDDAIRQAAARFDPEAVTIRRKAPRRARASGRRGAGSLAEFVASGGLARQVRLARRAWERPDLPYHNIDHCVETGFRAASLAASYDLDPVPFLVAGVWHDCDHTGDPDEPDTVNVARAITAWLAHGRPALAARGWDESRLGLVSDLIAATAWPHEEPASSVGALVIRDADLAQTLSPAWRAKHREETGCDHDPAFHASHMRLTPGLTGRPDASVDDVTREARLRGWLADGPLCGPGPRVGPVRGQGGRVEYGCLGCDATSVVDTRPFDQRETRSHEGWMLDEAVAVCPECRAKIAADGTAPDQEALS